MRVVEDKLQSYWSMHRVLLRAYSVERGGEIADKALRGAGRRREFSGEGGRVSDCVSSVAWSTGQRGGVGRDSKLTGGAQSQVLPGFTLTTAVHGKEILPSMLELIST